jgi:hypothetical protein
VVKARQIKLDAEEMRCENMDWFHLAQCTKKWRVVVKTAFRDKKKFLTFRGNRCLSTGNEFLPNTLL